MTAAVVLVHGSATEILVALVITVIVVLFLIGCGS